MTRTFPKFGYNPVTGDWNDSLTGNFLWSNVNVSEAVPDVMTPSTWSLWWIYHYEASPFQFPVADPFCGNICGRPYLNLSLLVSVYRAIGRDVRKELQGDLIGSAPADFDIPTIPLSRVAVYRSMLTGMLRAQLQASRDQKGIPAFVEDMPGWCCATRDAIAGCRDAADLLELWQEKIRPMVFRSCQMLRSVTMVLGDRDAKLRQELSAVIGEGDASALLVGISATSAELASLGPLTGLSRVKDGRMSRAEYLERYGHRGPHEMELSAPGADDDLGFSEAQWHNLVVSAGDVEALLAKHHADTGATWQRFKPNFGGKAKIIRRELDQLAAAAEHREAVRSEVTRVTRLVRRFLLRAGEVTGLLNDIFFLSLDEIVEVLGGEESSTARIAARRESYSRYASLPPYPALIVGKFDPLQWAADPHRRSDLYDARQARVGAPTSTIKGFAGASGHVEGRVRRIDCPEDGAQLQPGEILVTVTTNVGWTPLFPRLAAIVTDVGAPLSHAAIVAREMGIPAVVGCGNATMMLKTGDRIHVDGEHGTVEIVQRA